MDKDHFPVLDSEKQIEILIHLGYAAEPKRQALYRLNNPGIIPSPFLTPKFL